MNSGRKRQTKYSRVHAKGFACGWMNDRTRRGSEATIPVDIENMPFDVPLAHRAYRPIDAHGGCEDINI